MPNGVARDVPAVALPEAVSPATRTSVNLSEDLKQLRAQARERDQFLDLLRRTRADFENYQSASGASRRRSAATSTAPCRSTSCPCWTTLERAAAAAERAGTPARWPGVWSWCGRCSSTCSGGTGSPIRESPRAAVRPGPAPRGETVAGPPANTVVRVLKEGYRIHDRLLRPAEVVVAAPPDTQS